MQKFSLFKETGAVTTGDNTTMETKTVEQLADEKYPDNGGLMTRVIKMAERDAFIANYTAAQSEMVKKSEVVALIDYIIQAYESENKFGSNPKPVAAIMNLKNHFNEKFNS